MKLVPGKLERTPFIVATIVGAARFQIEICLTLVAVHNFLRTDPTCGPLTALDRERGRPVARAPSPPHATIGRLDVPGKPGRVEQRGSIAISPQPLAQLDQPPRSARKLERQLLIFLQR